MQLQITLSSDHPNPSISISVNDNATVGGGISDMAIQGIADAYCAALQETAGPGEILSVSAIVVFEPRSLTL